MLKSYFFYQRTLLRVAQQILPQPLTRRQLEGDRHGEFLEVAANDSFDFQTKMPHLIFEQLQKEFGQLLNVSLEEVTAEVIRRLREDGLADNVTSEFSFVRFDAPKHDKIDFLRSWLEKSEDFRKEIASEVEFLRVEASENRDGSWLPLAFLEKLFEAYLIPTKKVSVGCQEDSLSAADARKNSAKKILVGMAADDEAKMNWLPKNTPENAEKILRCAFGRVIATETGLNNHLEDPLGFLESYFGRKTTEINMLHPQGRQSKDFVPVHIFNSLAHELPILPSEHLSQLSTSALSQYYRLFGLVYAYSASGHPRYIQKYLELSRQLLSCYPDPAHPPATQTLTHNILARLAATPIRTTFEKSTV